MPYIQFEDNQFPLRVGEMSIGTGAGSDIRLEGPEQLGIQALVQVTADHHVAIRRQGASAVVRVNGVQLGAEPTPLIHGDKVEVAGHELQFGDDRKGGSTHLLSNLNIPELQRARASSPARPTAATGGRLVSLVDGREYPVPGTGLTIGREAGCDVVVPSNEVSRRHAELTPSGDGYVVSDLSTNGVFVNGVRVQSSQVLGRGDILRIGNEEFRFYADVVANAEASAPSPEPAASAPAASAPAASAPAAASSAAGATPAKPAAAAAPKPAAKAPTPPATPAAAAAAVPSSAAVPATGAAVRPPLATLEVTNEGVLKGHRFELRQPLVHVGRGAHNDVMVNDDSVSDSHAKIQKRDTGWFIVDMGSTNGTYVAGRRIDGEARLSGGGEVLRFGGIKMNFRPAMDVVDDAKGTRAITGVSVDQARRMAAQASRVTAEAEESATESRGLPAWLWVVVLLLVGAGAFFILQGRS
jgi:pSer/pThr/pTyr-binding forkhead associated (FHA) protein